LAGAEGLEPSARGFGGLGSSLKNKSLQAFLRHFDDTFSFIAFLVNILSKNGAKIRLTLD
jgi:hypothetical protein